MPRSASTSPWAMQSRQNVRDAVDCPTCVAKRGEMCVELDTGVVRQPNHAARHALATGEDPTGYAYGNQRARQGRRRAKKWEQRTPGGW